MTQAVSPVNITAAALITQFALVIIVFVTTVIMRWGEPRESVFRDSPNSTRLHVVTLGFGVLTIGCLLFSDEFANIWKPLFTEMPFGGLGWSFALQTTFLLNIVWVTVLAAMTGGGTTSPFSPIYFIVPALAIFLRESPGRIVLDVVLVSVGFSWNLLTGGVRGGDRGGTNRTLAYGFVSVACLVLSTLIGFVTRPR